MRNILSVGLEYHTGASEWLSEAPMEKGRADYYPSRPQRAKINAQSRLFNREAPLIKALGLGRVRTETEDITLLPALMTV